ncbi:MAG: O-methyltransferase family 3 [Thermoleophilia bacterium]|nr:O-methyltransferase family 3 [Thermoleophilia bacterium]
MTTSFVPDAAQPIDDDADLGSAGGNAWVDGFGVTSPDVTRYGDALRTLPDAVLLAMRNVAESEGIPIVDADTAALCALLLRHLEHGRIVEAGTGIGYLTLHLARAIPMGASIMSVEFDPVRQSQAHAFVTRDTPSAVVELRLGDPGRVIERELAGEAGAPPALIDALVLTDPALPRLDLFDQLANRIKPGGLVLVPHALRGGRVADNAEAWGGDPEVEAQRLLNRVVATDPRFTDALLLPVGDGLLVARRRA